MPKRYWIGMLPWVLFGSNPALAAEVGTQAPSCAVQSLDGSRSFDLAGHAGKVVLIDFWASWCGPCAESFPFLDGLQTEFRAQGLEVIGVGVDEELVAARAFARKLPVGFSLGHDPRGVCPNRYGVRAMPASYLVDRQGVIRQVHLGFKSGDKQAIRRQVQDLLAQP